MQAGSKILAVIILILLAFLVGFLPQYLARRDLEAQIDDLRFKLNLAELRDELALTYLHAARSDYGTAQEFSTSFFNRLGDVLSRITDEQLVSRLEEIMAARDEVTTGLARAEAAVRERLQQLLLTLHQATENYKQAALTRPAGER